jgi:hypothetical protein
MRKKLFLIKVLIAVLVACSSPIQVSLPNARPLDISESLLPESAPFGVDGPLASSVLLAQWNDGYHTLKPIDPLTGESIPGYDPIDLGDTFASAFSPDGRTLAVISPTQTPGREVQLRLIDLETWQTEELPIEYDGIRLYNSYHVLKYSADGKQLAILYQGDDGRPQGANYLSVINIEQHRVAAQLQLDVAPRNLAFMPDGKTLAVFGTYAGKKPGSGFETPAAILFNANDLSIAWEQTLPGILYGFEGEHASARPEDNFSWYPAVVFAPQHQALYIVHADEDKLTTVDFANRSAHTVEIQPQRSWFEQWLAAGARVAEAKMMNGVSKQAVLSMDGGRLYIVGTHSEVIKNTNGDYTFSMTSLGLKVIDAATGIEVAQSDIEASQIQLSPDGAQLYLHHYLWSGTDQTSEEWTDIVDAERLELVARLDDSYIFPARRLNGEPIILTYEYANRGAKLSSIDPQSLNVIHSWSLDSDGWWLSMP